MGAGTSPVIRTEPATPTIIKKGLLPGATTYSLKVGEFGFLPDSCGFGAMMKPTKEVGEFTSTNREVLSCRRKDVTPPGFCGDAQYEHQFAAKSPGTVTCTNGDQILTFNISA